MFTSAGRLLPASRNKAVVPDPFFSNVTLLTACDSTAFTDVKGHALTANGTISMSTAHTKFTNYSLFVNGAGNLTAADSPDWDISGDFTFEAWVYPTSTGGTQYVLSHATLGSFGNGAFDFLLVDGGPAGNTHIGGANVGNVNSSVGILPNEWSHICYERAGSTYRVYANGVVGATASGSGTFNDSTLPLAIGSDSANSNRFVGYVGQVRITKGVARYNGAFTPPTAAFPSS